MGYDGLELLIGGERKKTTDTRAVHSPTTGQVIAEVPEAGAAEVEAALSAARQAQKDWGRLAPIERAATMRRIADLIALDRETLVQIVVDEQGKPIAEARGEIGGAAEFFRYFAEFARRIEGEILPSDARDEQIWIQRVPIDVVAAIIPWNYPAALVSRKVAPAMIAGDTIVLKPHELPPPLSALHGRAFRRGRRAARCRQHRHGRGRDRGRSPDRRTRHRPDDHDGQRAYRPPDHGARGRTHRTRVAGTRRQGALYRHAGCRPRPRREKRTDVSVHELRSGLHLQRANLCSRGHLRRLPRSSRRRRSRAAAGRSACGRHRHRTQDQRPRTRKSRGVRRRGPGRGRQVALGGHRPETPPVVGGHWYLPTILTDVTPDMQIMQREIFGPVVPVARFSTPDEAFALANDSTYGLSAYLFTNEMPSIMRAVRDVDSGELYINRIGPESLQGFHVGYRQSDDGNAGLEIYLKKKTVYMNYAGSAPTTLMPY